MGREPALVRTPRAPLVRGLRPAEPALARPGGAAAPVTADRRPPDGCGPLRGPPAPRRRRRRAAPRRHRRWHHGAVDRLSSRPRRPGERRRCRCPRQPRRGLDQSSAGARLVLWYSTSAGWRHLDDGIGNANGPVIFDLDGRDTLVFANTQASAVCAYSYDAARGEVAERRVSADVGALGGMPDGA
jgi:hypothetical protein